MDGTVRVSNILDGASRTLVAAPGGADGGFSVMATSSNGRLLATGKRMVYVIFQSLVWCITNWLFIECRYLGCSHR